MRVKNIIPALLLISSQAYSSDMSFPICMAAPEISSPFELDRLYEESEVVFLANVEIDYSSSSQFLKWDYSLIVPALKGRVVPNGVLRQDMERCTSMTAIEKGVYLIFWKSGPEAISNLNSRAVVYGNGMAYEEWVLEWVQAKRPLLQQNWAP